jgi:hypothetical protein
MSNENSASRGDLSPPSPALPSHSEDGVDLTLIRWMLSLTPEERLQVLQDHVDNIMSIRNATELR